MTHLYLAPYVGTGIVGLSKGKFVNDPWRPRGSEQPGWAAIDLRPGGVGLSGFALMLVPVRDDTIGDYLGGEMKTTSLATKSTVESTLGLTLQETTPQMILAELLLVHGKDDGTRWKNLRVHRDGMYRLWLGGTTPLWEGKTLSGGSTITDNFNRGNQTGLGTSSEGWSWTILGAGSYDIVSNAASIANTSVVHARADSDLASSDHYAQATVASWTTSTGMAVKARKDNSTTLTYYMWFATNTGHYLYKNISGSLTQLGSAAGGAPAVAEVMKISVNGSSIEGSSTNPTVGPTTVTDTAITSGTRAGFGYSYRGGSGVGSFDDWSAADLAAAGLSIPVAMHSYRQRRVLV